LSSFEHVIDRRGSSSVKWDRTKEVFGYEDVLPMWVADMDFAPPEPVIEALKKRMEHPIFGYTYAGASTAGSIKEWMAKRHGWEIQSSWVQYSPGVVPALATIIQALTEPGDKVLIQSPVYPPFFNLVKENDRVVENAQLVYSNGEYSIDFTAFEKALQNGVKLFLLCNPHNPGGRVWTKEELTRIASLCKEYGVVIASDEIHSDLIYRPHHQVPIASLPEGDADAIITCIAPSKTFNLAGLQASAMITKNEEIRNKIAGIHAKQGFFTLNALGISAMEAAYRHGEEWLEDVIAYLEENVALTRAYLKEHLPSLHLVEPEGTYLLWIDCSKTGLSDEDLKDHLLRKGKLALEEGTKYGEGGEGFVRMNIACPKETLLEGLDRLKTALT
jgi:cysteine-S-conjugate beta-lyase